MKLVRRLKGKVFAFLSHLSFSFCNQHQHCFFFCSLLANCSFQKRQVSDKHPLPITPSYYHHITSTINQSTTSKYLTDKNRPIVASYFTIQLYIAQDRPPFFKLDEIQVLIFFFIPYRLHFSDGRKKGPVLCSVSRNCTYRHFRRRRSR